MEDFDKTQVITVDYLKPGMILSGSLYDMKGAFLWPPRVPIREEFISNLNSMNITLLTYRPISYEVSISKESVENPIISDILIKRIYEDVSYIVWDIVNDNHIKVEKVRPTIEEVAKEIRFASGGKTLNLMDIKGYDSYTYVHSINVSFLSIYIGTKLGMSIDKVNSLGIGGLLIDIGKVKIPKSVLDKKEALSRVELETIRKHPLLGYQLVKDSKEIEEIVKLIVLLHHEALDGSGYPLGVDSSKIDQFIRIVTICDVFDAMISEKPYRPAFPVRFALEELLKNAGTKYDPELTVRFAMEISKMYKIISPLVVGTVVELTSGEISVIASKHSDYDSSPVVIISLDPAGNAYRSPASVDLIKDPAGRKIKRLIFDFNTISRVREIAKDKGLI